jgi:hypothetical protein
VDWVNPRAAVLGQVIRAEESAGLRRERQDRLGQFSLVKRLRARLGDEAQAARHVWTPPPLAHAGGVSTRGKDGPARLELRPALVAPLEQRRLPAIRRHRGHRVSALGVGDGGFEETGKRQSTETRMEIAPCRRRARHRDRQPAIAGHVCQAAPSHEIGGECRRGSPRTV